MSLGNDMKSDVFYNRATTVECCKTTTTTFYFYSLKVTTEGKKEIKTAMKRVWLVAMATILKYNPPKQLM